MRTFDHSLLIESLRRFPTVLTPLLADLSREEALHRPDEQTWSILEIVCHLGDIEVEDMRTRLRLTLENPEQDWPPIDPTGWAVERKYRQQHLADALARFLEARRESLAWLDSLMSPDFQREHRHPKFGSMRAGDLLSAWSAHDLLHLRQITKRRYELLTWAAEPFGNGYAGAW